MADKPARTDHFRAVIADLKAKRDQIDGMIAQLEAFEYMVANPLRIHPPVSYDLDTPPIQFDIKPDPNPPHNSEPRSFSLVGMPDTEHMSLGEACTAILKHARKPVMLREVVGALIEIGFGNSENLRNNVGSALYHRAKVRKDVERVPPKYWRYVDQPEQEKPASVTRNTKETETTE